LTKLRDRTWSRLGHEIEREITSLNDQYYFFLFLEYQFFEELHGLSTTSVNRFTTDVFNRNQYSSKIHVRLRDLPSFRDAHRSASFGAYFATSYEVAASFTDKALEVLREKSRVRLRLPLRGREGPEQFYARVLTSWGYSLPAAELIDTLSFMRHRRNALVHLSRTPNPPYMELARRAGLSLNAFWTRARVQIDFATPSTGPLEDRETLGLLKLMRIVIRRLDTHFVSVIDNLGLVRAEARRLFGGEKVRMNRDVSTRRVQKLRYEIMQEYGLSLPESDLRAAVQTVGTK
jgi:hypothetical protein